jgi:hypothetical protein
VAIPFTCPRRPRERYTNMDVVNASTGFRHGKATHKEECYRELGQVDSANTRTIRQVSLQDSATTQYLLLNARI